MRTWPLRQAILALPARLARLVATVRIVRGRIGAAQGALLGDDLASEILRGMHLTHKALIALRLSWRDRQRQGRKAPAGAGPDGEATGALREKADPRAGAVVDLDPPHLAVGVRIKFDRDVVGTGR